MPADNSKAYSSCEDVILNKLMQKGDKKAADVLIKRYFPLISSLARELCSNTSVEAEDLSQEGLIGFLFAANSYREDKGASFKTYAMLCSERMMLSRLRHETKNSTIPKEKLIYIDSPDGGEIAASELSDPESAVISGEEFERLNQLIATELTDLEKRVFYLYLSGCSYLEIAQRINTSQKTVDNALQRVRRKLRN